MTMMIVMSVYSIVDGLFVSNFVGTTAFAAVNMMWPAIMLCGAIGLMTGAGGSALISKTMGEGDRAKANAIFSLIVRFTFALGVVLGALMFIFMPEIAGMLGAKGELLGGCITYGRICVSVMPLFFVQMSFQSLFMTSEKPQLGTVLYLGSGVLNAVLDALLILVFDMGLAGAAVATAAGIALGGLFPLYYYSSRRNNSALKIVRDNAAATHLVKVCTNGLSEYIGNVALSIVGICYNAQLLKYMGENGVAAYGILMYFGLCFASIFIGYNITVTPVVGYNFGAQDHTELQSLLKKSLKISTASGCIMAGLIILAARPLAGIFVHYDPALEEMTVRAIRLYFLSFTLCGINMFASAWFTALNNGLVSAVAAFSRTLVFELSSIFIIPAIFGIENIWYACDAAELMAFIVSVILLLSFRKRYGY